MLPGDRHPDAVERQLSSAHVVIVLVSAAFLGVDDLHAGALRHALDAHRAGRQRVVPLLVRPCDWEPSELGDLEPLPRNRRPITTWEDPDEAWTHVVSALRDLAVGPGRDTIVASPANKPGARLWVHGWAKRAYDEPPTVELDWTAHFDHQTRRVPPPAQWPALIEELRVAEKTIAQLPGGSFVDVRGQMPLSVALAVGWAFAHGKHYRLRVQQFTDGPSAFWDSGAERSERRLEVVRRDEHQDGEDLALALSVTADTRPVLDRFLAGRARPFRAVVVAAPDGGPSPRSIGSDRDAVALAAAAKELLRELRHAHGLPARTHVFLAAPVGFALFFGQALNALGEVVSYERAPDDTYQPAVMLPSG